MPDKITIIREIQRIVARAYNGNFAADEIRPEWHLHSPWPPIGMDDIVINSMLGPINAFIKQFKPKKGVTATELGKIDTVVELTKLVAGKLKP